MATGGKKQPTFRTPRAQRTVRPQIRGNFCPEKFCVGKIPPRSLKQTGKIAPHLSMVKGKAQGRVSLLRGTPLEELRGDKPTLTPGDPQYGKNCATIGRTKIFQTVFFLH